MVLWAGILFLMIPGAVIVDISGEDLCGCISKCGPDTYGCLVNQAIMLEVQNTMGNYLDNAHNAFLQYLITMGLTGMITYMFFLITVFRHLFRNHKKNPYILGILLATICYVFQSLVNLELPVVTPSFWLLISMGMAVCQKTTSQPDYVTI